MKKHLPLLLVFALHSTINAQPAINNTSGIISNNQSVVITGTGFGSKTIAAPVLWDAVDNQPAYTGLNAGDRIPTTGNAPFTANSVGNYPNYDVVRYADSANRGFRTAHYKTIGPSSTMGYPRSLGGANPPDDHSKLYITWWYKPSQDPHGKFLRVWDDQSGNGTRISITRNGMYCSHGTPGVYYMYPYTAWGHWDGIVGAWNRMEVLLDTVDHTMQFYVNGRKQKYRNSSSPEFPGHLPDSMLFKFPNNKGLTPYRIGFDGGNDSSSTMITEHGEIYIDTTFARVEIGDSPIWDSCNHREIQIPTAWSSTSITVTINQGTFNNCDTVYLFVADRSGKVNQTGYRVIINEPACCNGGAPSAAIVAGGPLTVCQGDSVTLHAGNGFNSYLWSTSETTQSIVINQSGSYSVVVTNSNGCSGTSAPVVVTVNPLPTINLGNDTTIASGAMLTLFPGSIYSSYTWSTGANTMSIAVNTSGVYYVTVTDPFGCTATDTINVTVLASTTGFDEKNYMGAELIIYPNPNNGKFTIKIFSPINSAQQIIITNVLGQIVYREHIGDINNGLYETTIDLSEFPKGIYCVKLRSEAGEMQAALAVIK